jgi:antitoxin component of MazEF toxin-antitoxin module
MYNVITMKASIITIGNSKGVRIPKPLLEESGLVKDVEIKLTKDGLKITPLKTKTPKVSETLLMSQKTLAKEWDMPEEDVAWADL